MKTLIIDNDPLTCGILRRKATALGCEVDVAKNPHEDARNASRAGYRIVIFSPAGVSNDNGIDIISSIMEEGQERHVHVILVGDSASRSSLIGSLASMGVSDFLIKPFNMVEVDFRLRSAIRTVETEDAIASGGGLDSLSGALNRSVFVQVLDAESSRRQRYGDKKAILHISLVLDSHDYRVMRESILKAASVLKRTRRSGDYIANLTGGAFCMLIHGVDGDGCSTAAERIGKALSDASINAVVTAMEITDEGESGESILNQIKSLAKGH